MPQYDVTMWLVSDPTPTAAQVVQAFYSRFTPAVQQAWENMLTYEANDTDLIGYLNGRIAAQCEDALKYDFQTSNIDSADIESINTWTPTQGTHEGSKEVRHDGNDWIYATHNGQDYRMVAFASFET